MLFCGFSLAVAAFSSWLLISTRELPREVVEALLPWVLPPILEGFGAPLDSPLLPEDGSHTLS